MIFALATLDTIVDAITPFGALATAASIFAWSVTSSVIWLKQRPLNPKVAT